MPLPKPSAHELRELAAQFERGADFHYGSFVHDDNDREERATELGLWREQKLAQMALEQWANAIEGKKTP